MQDAIGPIYGNTQKLQVMGTSTDEFLEGKWMYADILQISKVS
jgi:hypothetical protein